MAYILIPETYHNKNKIPIISVGVFPHPVYVHPDYGQLIVVDIGGDWDGKTKAEKEYDDDLKKIKDKT